MKVGAGRPFSKRLTSVGVNGTPPTTPRQGASLPWTPLLPTLVGLRFASVLGPTRGGVAIVGYSPPLLGFVGGHPPQPPAMGALPPWTPLLPTLVGLGFAGVLGPTRGGVANAGYSSPLLVSWGDTPKPPAMGALPPWTPLLPTLVGLGFASVLGPTRGGVANAGYSSPLLVSWGDTPKPPAMGALPPGPPVCPPPWAEGLPGFCPLRGEKGRTPQNFPPSLAGKGVRGLGRKGPSPSPGLKNPGQEAGVWASRNDAGPSLASQSSGYVFGAGDYGFLPTLLQVAYYGLYLRPHAPRREVPFIIVTLGFL